ncbi:GNAT family N-acetyltransferase [Streptomyces sp. bgisy029]|uniref:GNAT family N-acetyltransferase n=1 Tax=Streptomyces sp. bgisy029 TaxID=3413771 RepID=UPI003D73D87A
MAPVLRRTLSPIEAPRVLRALNVWTQADAPAGSLHPGDVGWLLRHADATVHLWVDARGDGRTDPRIDTRHDSAAPVAVGFLDGRVLRVTAAPDADLGAVAADAAELLAPGIDRSDGLPVPGWQPDLEEPWLVLSWTPKPVTTRAEPVGAPDAADRVLIHRSVFTGSKFALKHWETMRASPAGRLIVETLVRTPDGDPAAAATGWFGGTGRCGLLEPVGTHPDHRGHGYGRDAVLGACAALADRGASAVAVLARAENEAAVTLYRSAGFTVVRERHRWKRPGFDRQAERSR